MRLLALLFTLSSSFLVNAAVSSTGASHPSIVAMITIDQKLITGKTANEKLRSAIRECDNAFKLVPHPGGKLCKPWRAPKKDFKIGSIKNYPDAAWVTPYTLQGYQAASCQVDESGEFSDPFLYCRCWIDCGSTPETYDTSYDWYSGTYTKNSKGKLVVQKERGYDEIDFASVKDYVQDEKRHSKPAPKSKHHSYCHWPITWFTSCH